MPGLLKKMLCCGLKNSSSHNKVSEGHVRVYVGKETPCKFEVEANYLNHPLFENLLQLSVEEFGYSYKGALRIACEIDLFQYLLNLLESRNPSAHYMEFRDLISKFYDDHGNGTTDFMEVYVIKGFPVPKLLPLSQNNRLVSHFHGD